MPGPAAGDPLDLGGHVQSSAAVAWIKPDQLPVCDRLRQWHYVDRQCRARNRDRDDVGTVHGFSHRFGDEARAAESLQLACQRDAPGIPDRLEPSARAVEEANLHAAQRQIARQSTADIAGADHGDHRQAHCATDPSTITTHSHSAWYSYNLRCIVQLY